MRQVSGEAGEVVYPRPVFFSWVIEGLTIGVIVGLAIRLWRARRARAREASDEPPIELVLLLREPRVLDREHLLGAVQRAFGRDLSRAGDEATEFALAKGAVGMVQTDGYAFPTVAAPEPMVADPERSAEGIAELRMRVAFAEHRAFVSVGCASRPPSATRDEAYARVGRLIAELVDDTTSLVYAPEVERGLLMNEKTLAGLRSGDPLAAMQKMTFNAIGLVSGEDPRMVEATAEARRRLPEFVEAVRATADHRSFLVKGPFTDGTHTEFMWVEPKGIEGATIRGTLANEPFQVRGLRHGSAVEVAFAEVSDWVYAGPEGPVGPFTEGIVRDAMGGS